MKKVIKQNGEEFLITFTKEEAESFEMYPDCVADLEMFIEPKPEPKIIESVPVEEIQPQLDMNKIILTIKEVVQDELRTLLEEKEAEEEPEEEPEEEVSDPSQPQKFDLNEMVEPVKAQKSKSKSNSFGGKS